jgi:hypothetical protein
MMAKTLTFSTDPHDPTFWPLGLRFQEQMQRLNLLAPHRAKGFKFFMDEAQRSQKKQKKMTALKVLLERALREEVWRASGVTPKGRGAQ